MSSRYTTPGPWTTISRTNVNGYYGTRVGAVQIETGPLIDTKCNNQRYEEGAHRVTITKRPEGVAVWPRGKTFKGETAWSQAERYRDDCIQDLNTYARNEGL
jgi:hypothetical protein